MELFEEIRRGHAAGETILALARKHQAHSGASQSTVLTPAQGPDCGNEDFRNPPHLPAKPLISRLHKPIATLRCLATSICSVGSPCKASSSLNSVAPNS